MGFEKKDQLKQEIDEDRSYLCPLHPPKLWLVFKFAKFFSQKSSFLFPIAFF
jgi:hypothetical protein